MSPVIAQKSVLSSSLDCALPFPYIVAAGRPQFGSARMAVGFLLPFVAKGRPISPLRSLGSIRLYSLLAWEVSVAMDTLGQGS